MKSAAYLKRLREDVDRWVAKGVIDLSVGQALIGEAAAYHGTDDRRSLVLPGLAGLAILLGILALIGANWAGMSGITRLGAVFGLLITLFGLGGELFARQRQAWADIATTLGAALFGGGLIVIGQLYHTGATTSSFLAMWAVAAGGVAFLFPATLTGIFAGLLTLAWTLAHNVELGAGTGPYWAIALIAGLAIRARLSRSIALVNILAFTAIIWSSLQLFQFLEAIIVRYSAQRWLAFTCFWVGATIIVEIVSRSVPIWAMRTISAWFCWTATLSFIWFVFWHADRGLVVSQMEVSILGLGLFSLLTAYGATPGRAWFRVAGVVGFVACAIALFTLINTMILAGLALIGFGCALIVVILASNRLVRPRTPLSEVGRAVS
ncbi:MAG: DUF2157 domain-containing protein [Pseudomonadota bacterium]